MCGFTGFLGGFGNTTALGQRVLLRRMAARIAHRGPDDEGQWCDDQAQVGMAHRRLSILDLSAAGRQPMPSASGRFVIAFNGEIYNHLALRAMLEAAGAGVQWNGHSDTETLLAGFEAWGIERMLGKTRGMFAFAAWDRQQRVLTLARDRLGEKPLYYGWQGAGPRRAFLFASELKALTPHPAFENQVDRQALAMLLRHNYVPAPMSIYQGLFKLEAGSMLQVSLADAVPRILRYWQGESVAADGIGRPFEGSEQEAAGQLEELLREVVREQMLSDVPLGAFLSGGIDSSTVVALMQANSARPVQTFSIGFDEKEFDESEEARQVARHLGTDHTDLHVSGKQAMGVIPNLPAIYDEPFSDSSQIPTFLVAQLARTNVTVALSGDGGDELFCGYTRYQMTQRLWSRIERIPLALRRGFGSAIMSVTPDAWNRYASLLSPLLPASLRMANPGDKLHKGAGVLGCSNIDVLYQRLISHWPDPARVVHGASGEPPHDLMRCAALQDLEPVQRMMANDMLTYLPDDILVKVDRAAMAVSLETRVPFLDPRVVEFAWRLPLGMKLRQGQTKWILRQVLYRYVPPALVERPKMGFGVPLGHWLRGPLRDWAHALLDPARLRREGWFNAAQITAHWQEHLSGRRDWQYLLWDVLMFQLWLEHRQLSAPAVEHPEQAAPTMMQGERACDAR